MLLVTFIGMSKMQLAHFAELKACLRNSINEVAKRKEIEIDLERIKFCVLRSSEPPSLNGEKVFIFLYGLHSGDWMDARSVRTLKETLILESLRNSAEAYLTKFSESVVEAQCSIMNESSLVLQE